MPVLPTIDAQLASVRAALTDLAGRVGGEPGAELADLARSLRIVERTWGARASVLADDVADLAALLADVAPDELVAVPGPGDVAALEAACRAQRAVLARLVADAGDDDAGRALRRRATACMRASVARQPW